jgi:hypothetical protein
VTDILPTTERRARVTTTRAAVADFRAECSQWLRSAGRQPEWASWAYRLADLAELLIPAVDLAEQPAPPAE